MDCRTALLTILDQVDYTNKACGATEMVGAVLSKEVIALARKAIADEASQQNVKRTWSKRCPNCETLFNNEEMYKNHACAERPHR